MSAVPQIPPEPRSSAAASMDRRIQMLRTAMGPLIAAALQDPDIVEVMLNPDRTLWVDRLSSGRAPMGVELPEADGERIIRLVAAHVGAEVHRGQPLLSAELPETGERFEGILPPAAPGPAFALRKRAIGVIPLSRYIEDGMMTAEQAGFLVRAVHERQNVLIAGATSSGKTTLANALLAEIAATGDRVLVLEDTVELQCAARDHVPLRTRAGVVSMTELVRSSMRLRPDRVVVGEVLTTLLGVGAELVAPENRQDGNRIVIAGRDSAQDSINQVGQEMTRRNMNIQPTLTERPGLPVRIIVNRDLVLRPYQPLFFNRGASQ